MDVTQPRTPSNPSAAAAQTGAQVTQPRATNPHARWIRWPDSTAAGEYGRKGPRFGYGADYNPDQWDRETWAEDVRLMREAKVTIVNLAIFAWAVIEPEPGRYEFGLFDEVMDLLHENGIAVDLATATAAPPAWLVTAHPEMLPVDQAGHTLGFGARQSYCPSSPVYREHAVRLARQVAEHYKDHPALAMWHVGNEYGCHSARCYCDVSAQSFRDWLKSRYADDGDGARLGLGTGDELRSTGDPALDRLNEAWATAFWSQRYTAWEQIQPPRLAPTFCNPTQQLDFARFSSDALLELYRSEAEVLHEVTPGVPVTTNFMVMDHTKPMDYLRWGPEMDLVSNDHYLDQFAGPRLASGAEDTALELAFSADLTRGCARGGPWMLMEQSTSAVNWGRVNRPKRPGELWRNSLAQVARGADAISYFQWRQSRGGAEKYHSALVPHAGPDSRLFRDVVEQGRRLDALTEVLGSRTVSDTALLYDWPNWWAVELDSHPDNTLVYRRQCEQWYGALWRAGHGTDVIGTDDLAAQLSGVGAPGGYRLVVVPALYLVSDAAAAALRAYVEAGGHVLVTYFSGIVDESDHVRLGGYPGAFRELLGVRVEEFGPLREDTQVTLSDGSMVTRWAERVDLAPGTEAVLSYADGDHAGEAAVTVRRTASGGSAWYVGAHLGEEATAQLMARITAEAGVRPLARADGRLELARRTHQSSGDVEVAGAAATTDGPGVSYLFAINHGDAAVTLHEGGRDLLTGTDHSESVEVPAGGTVVLRQ